MQGTLGEGLGEGLERGRGGKRKKEEPKAAASVIFRKRVRPEAGSAPSL
jgi:hypothetical protein